LAAAAPAAAAAAAAARSAIGGGSMVDRLEDSTWASSTGGGSGWRGRLNMREWKNREQIARVENAIVDYSCMESRTDIIQRYGLS